MADRLDDQGLATVFGGSGFIGRYAVAAIAKQGWRARAAVRRPDLAGFLQPAGRVGQVFAVQANVRYPDSVRRAIEGARAVVNSVGVLTSDGRQSFRAIHVEGPRAIAKAAREAGVERLVHISAIGADPKSTLELRPLQGRGRAGRAGGVSRRGDPASLDRVRAGGRVLQPLRRDGAHLAVPAADRRGADAVPAGVRRRRGGGRGGVPRRCGAARRRLRARRPGGAELPRAARPHAGVDRPRRASICACRSGSPSCRPRSPGRCPTACGPSPSIRCACCSTTTS